MRLLSESDVSTLVKAGDTVRHFVPLLSLVKRKIGYVVKASSSQSPQTPEGK